MAPWNRDPSIPGAHMEGIVVENCVEQRFKMRFDI